MTTVLQVIPNLGAGGAEQACVDVAVGLKAAGHRALVVSAGGPRVAEILKAGGLHYVWPVHSKNPLMMLINMFWLARFIQNQRVDIIHARSRAPAWSAFGAARMMHKSFVTTNHAAYKFSNPFKKFYNSIMAKGDLVIAISDFVACHVAQSYGLDSGRIRTIPRGVDLVEFAPENISVARQDALRHEWGVGLSQPLILLPSRLSPIKGQSVFIEAMSLLPPELKHFHAVIVGDDQGRANYRLELAELIASRGLGDRVKLVKHCTDMPAAYGLASLVVAPSLVPEGFGRVPVEAMVMGVPVIASRLGGFVETVRPGETGWLVEPNDPQALAAAIIDVLTKPEEEKNMIIQNARHYARRHYDKWKMVADTLAVYDELKKNHDR